MATPRRLATLVAYGHGLRARARDDVIDIFDVAAVLGAVREDQAPRPKSPV